MFAGMIADTAKEFGVDWPHLIAQVVSFGNRRFSPSTFLSYKPVLKILEERRQQIAGNHRQFGKDQGGIGSS
jgi:F0F1-type ATP synthase membrane subunit b/b'